MKLIVYGDFNCPLSYLASARVEVIRERGFATVEWRAIEHDRRIPSEGRGIQGTIADQIKAELAAVRRQLRPGEPLRLRVPRYESNTAAATAVYASTSPAEADEVRRRIFRAIWAEGRNVSNRVDVAPMMQPSTVDTSERAIYWRRCWLGLESPAVPMVLLHTGYVARRFVALACLGRLASTGSLPYRPWAEFRTDTLSGTHLEEFRAPGTHRPQRR